MTNNFKFSIILSLFESQTYLKETINSIINQTLDFKKNTQIIFVDNESLDDSKTIIEEYKEKYPENIKILYKKNEGVASSRNFALKHIEGEYVNFIEANDTLSKNALKEVFGFFNENKNEVDVVNIPVSIFNKEFSKYLFDYDLNQKKVIHLNKNPQKTNLTFYSSFIKKEHIQNSRFDTDLANSSEKLVLCRILLNKHTYGSVNTCTYHFRQRNSDNRFIENTITNRDLTEKFKFFFIPLIKSSKNDDAQVPEFIQHIVAYELETIVKIEKLEDYLETDEKIEEFWKYLTQIVQILDEDFIHSDKNLTDSIKSFLIYIKNKEFHIEINKEKNKVFLLSNNYEITKLQNHLIRFDIVDLKYGILNFTGSVHSRCDNKAISVEAVKKDKNGNKTIYHVKTLEYPTTMRRNKKYLGIPWDFYYHFDVSIPVYDDKCEISFRLVYEENSEKVILNNPIGFREFSGMSFINKYFVKDSKMLYLKKYTFIYTSFSYLKMLELEIISIIKILIKKEKFGLEGIFYKIVRFILFPFMKNKKIWLFIDRNTFADDNAEHLFKYSVKQHDGIDKYFLINKDSPDYKRLKKIDRHIVPYGSFKHKILHLFTDKFISSQVNKSLSNPFILRNNYIYEGLSKHDFCFIQHGVILHDLSSWIRKYSRNMLLFVTSSDLERDSIVKGHYNYSKDVVQTLGMARYDNLVNDAKKEILFIPTWRRKLDTADQLVNSHYFKYLNSFLNNKELINYVEKKGYRLVFRPHPDLWKFLDLFEIDEKIRLSSESYQEMFRDASVMITDYSSVFFDFAYLKKPVIYYQPESFGEFHYEKGYYDYETMGFGEIIKTEEELVSLVKEYIETDCQMKEKYKKRVEKFFKYNDKNNCKRTYEWIKDH